MIPKITCRKLKKQNKKYFFIKLQIHFFHMMTEIRHRLRNDMKHTLNGYFMICFTHSYHHFLRKNYHFFKNLHYIGKIILYNLKKNIL